MNQNLDIPTNKNEEVKSSGSYTIITLDTMWSTNNLRNRTEKLLNEKTAQGYQVISVAFGINLWWMPTAFITLYK